MTEATRPAAGDPTRFLIAMPWGRVGSSLLAAILSRSLRDQRLRMSIETLTDNEAWSADEQLAWARRHYALDGPAGDVTHIGAKESALAMRDPAAFTDLCARHGIRVVRMRRANVVKAAISQIRAEAYARATGSWSVPAGATGLGPSHIDPGVLRERIARMDRADRLLMDLFDGCAIHEVEYDDLQRDLAGVVRRVRDFLGIEQRPYSVPHEKATADDLAAAVENHAEIVASLRGTPYEAMLVR